MSLRPVSKKTYPAAKPSAQFELEWKKLEASIDRLLDFVDSGYKKPPDAEKWRQENMEAYACVYNLATNTAKAGGDLDPPQILYQRIKAKIENYLIKRVADQVNGKKGEDLLQTVYTVWDRHQLVVRWCRFQFSYLDNYYTKQQHIDPLRIMMLKCFSTAVYEKIKADGICEVLLNEIKKDRDGLEVNRTIMKATIGLFVEMGLDRGTNDIYVNDFEDHFLKSTAEYYRVAAAAWLNEPGGNFIYLKRVEKALNDDFNRAMNYLHCSSISKCVACVEGELLAAYQKQILEDPDAGTEALLVNCKTEELARMYSLFKRVPKGLDRMSGILRDYIKKEGKEINKKFCDGDLDGNAYIDACLSLHDKYTSLFKDHFENSSIFHKDRKEAYEMFFNETLSVSKGDGPGQKVTTSELLSTYCDHLMKNEKVGVDELEEKLEKFVQLFSYISDKDLFQEFYRKQMSKRLLVSKTDGDNERQLISKLKMKMGAPYTSKLEGMIVDKGLSAETQKNFLEGHKSQMKIDFSAQVLTTGFWPAFKLDSLNAPEILSHHLDLFKHFYDKTTQSRVLRWVHSLGSATLLAKFKKGPKDMIVATYQACVLLLFNEKESITPDELTKELDLPFDEIKRTIHSLSFGKFAILKKEGEKKGKSIGEHEPFIVNEDFTCPTRKFKVPNVIKSVGDPVEKTDETRRHVIEASIVRVMKSRKQLTHIELQTECIRQLSNYFKPDPKIIKKRIEDLIQRSYLERDETDRNVYRYLA